MRTATAGQDLQGMAWEEIREPGAYVDVTTGNLYRVSPENLNQDVAPVTKGAAAHRPQLVQLSRDPSIFPLGARILCARHRIEPNF